MIFQYYCYITYKAVIQTDEITGIYYQIKLQIETLIKNLNNK